MPRHARYIVPEIPLHIVQRGNNRSICFHDEQDFRVYLRALETGARTGDCDVHAYVLMGNHVHLLVTPHHEEAASGLMKPLSQNYAQYANRKYRRSGAFWDARFKSHLVSREDYFFSCQRYVEQNPLRAKLVSDVSAYQWSSFRANAGWLSCDWLRPHPLVSSLGTEGYVRYLHLTPPEAEVEEIRSALKGGFALGSERFQKEMAAICGPRVIRTRSHLQGQTTSFI